MTTNLTNTTFAREKATAPSNGHVLLELPDGFTTSWRLYTENSMWGGAIIGGTGSGTSVLLASLAHGAQVRGDTTVWYADGQDGASSPATAVESDWTANRAGAKKMLGSAAKIIRDRQQRFIATRLSGIAPTPDMSGLLILLADMRTVFIDQECVKHAETIVQMGSTTSVVIAGTAPDATLASFGGSRVLRDALTAHNVIVTNQVEGFNKT